MSDEKKPCEICGKMISALPMHIAKHMKTHEVKEATQSETGKDETMQEDVKIRRAEDRELYEKALAAQEQALAAPDVFVSERADDDMTALVKLYAPEAVDIWDGPKLKKMAERKAVFVPENELNKYTAQAYIPKFNEKGEFVKNGGGAVLVTCDRGLYETRKERARAESRNRVNATKGKIGTRWSGDGDANISHGNVRIEQAREAGTVTV